MRAHHTLWKPWLHLFSTNAWNSLSKNLHNSAMSSLKVRSMLKTNLLLLRLKMQCKLFIEKACIAFWDATIIFVINIFMFVIDLFSLQYTTRNNYELLWMASLLKRLWIDACDNKLTIVNIRSPLNWYFILLVLLYSLQIFHHSNQWKPLGFIILKLKRKFLESLYTVIVKVTLFR